MLDWFLSLYQQFVVLSKSNPVIAGAISLWGLGVGTYLVRNLPTKLWGSLRKQFTTSVTINNSTDYAVDRAFEDFQNWYDQTQYAKWSRRLALKTKQIKNKKHIFIAPGYGTHFFLWQGSLLWFHKVKIDSQGVDYQKEEITITILGRSREKLDSVLKCFVPKSDPNYLSVYKWEGRDWVDSQRIKQRPLKSIALRSDIKNDIVKNLDEFYAMKSWYDERGLNRKLSFLLHGVPGTGKTSIIKALASHYKKDIYVLNISAIYDSQLNPIFRKIPGDVFLILEDIDSSPAALSRSIQETGNICIEETSEKTPQISSSALSPDKKLSTTGLLNILDGIVSLNDIVIFMTTNYLERLDSALIRKGRTDLIFEIPALTRTEIVEYTSYMFNDHPDFDADVLQQTELIESITGSELQAKLLEYKTDYSGFLTSITAQSENHIHFLEAV